MIPLRDEKTPRHLPLANLALIAACIAAFAVELGAGSGLVPLLDRYALIPARLFALAQRSSPLDPEVWLPLFSSAFLHAGWLHFGGNLLYLWIFGDDVEDWLGPLRYLIFYLGGAVISGLAHAVSHPTSTVPTLGASGAIAAAMGAFLVLHPAARIRTLLLIPFAVRIVAVPAWIYLSLWLVVQLVAVHATDTANAADTGGVAWSAHIAGFVYGAAIALFLGRRPLRG